jgi:energy-coupling factor transport system ATP-binding protein
LIRLYLYTRLDGWCSRMIQIKDVSFAYSNQEPVVRELSLSIQKGEFVAIVGPNGSGKSTLAKLINGLLLPISGEIHMGELSTTNPKELMQIRQKIGMVFQNPENQMVATTVLDDVAFGLENIGFPPEKMMERIKDSLQIVKMWEHRLAEPHHLSGGQKQRVAIAGILAMRPEVILFDESTSMLDPEGRFEMMQIMKELHQEGLTIITITHDMEEASEATRVLLMQDGAVLRDRVPAQLFEEIDILQQNQLELPFAIEARERLNQLGLSLPRTIKTKEELVKHLWT